MFFEDSAIAFVIVEDVRFHELAFGGVVADTLLAFSVVGEFVDGNDLLFILFGILVELWFFAGEDNRPDN